MFERDYNFKGKHANIVTQLTTEIDSDTKFKLFERNIDVLIIAPIVGYLYGKMSKRDDEGPATDNVKKINFDQMNRESKTLNFNYELIMLLHNKDKLSIEDRLDNAFRYNSGTEEKEECNKTQNGIGYKDQEVGGKRQQVSERKVVCRILICIGIR